MATRRARPRPAGYRVDEWHEQATFRSDELVVTTDDENCRYTVDRSSMRIIPSAGSACPELDRT